jgi:hypothetical protein
VEITESEKKQKKAHDGIVPRYPVFSGIQDPMVRALVGLLVGCDPCPKGVVNSGPKAAFELLQRHSDKSGKALHETLAGDISNMTGSSVAEKDAVLCLAD